MILEIACRTIRNIAANETGMLRTTSPRVNQGRVPLRASSHIPANTAARMITRVKQPTEAATPAIVKFSNFCRLLGSLESERLMTD